MALAALVLIGAGSMAHAEQARPAITVTTDNYTGHEFLSDQNRMGLQGVKKSVQWDGKGRWGLKLEMTQSASRDMQLNDVQAGAYFRLTPSLRVGGAVSLSGSGQPDHTVLPQDQSAPRVKLETTFKF